MRTSEKRVRMSDGEWCRPDSKRAVKFPSKREWDGVLSCEVSSATGEEWGDETLYYAELERGLGWVLHRWSRWDGGDGGLNRWEWRDVEDAAAWLLAHADFDSAYSHSLDDLPAAVKNEIKETSTEESKNGS